MSPIYVVTILVSAFLLFLVQPMFARMALPLLGGSPAVWSTAVVFYQVALLAGYVYAHVVTTWLGVRRQAVLHAGLLLLPLLVLPIAIPSGWNPPSQSNPIPWLLSVMLLRVGLPFAVLAASSPMLQKWLAHTTHPAAAIPYFLYAASNVGSMAALLGYPVLIEPYLRLRTQSVLWAIAYGVLVVLTLICATLMWRAYRAGASATSLQAGATASAPIGAPADGVTLGRRARWVLLAFIPSSLMLSVTIYLSSNIAPFPLLWVIPLAIYLLTFVLVFASRPILPHPLMVRLFPIVLLPLVIAMAPGLPAWRLIPFHLVAFLVIGLVCHGAIAEDRPAPTRLTEFYLWLSVGGALGGIFNALLAPLIFTTLLEYPLVLVLAALVIRHPDTGATKRSVRWLDFVAPVVLGALMVAIFLGLRASGVESQQLVLALVIGLPAIYLFSVSRRPIQFALGIAAVFLVSTVYVSAPPGLLYTERSFFGINRVVADSSYHALRHGNTLHGVQSLDPARRCDPLSYYTPTGPIGQTFAALRDTGARQRVAVVGLGAGSLAAYSQPGEQWTFYEIDPSVARIARNSQYFTFLRDCAPDAAVVLGDGRLSLAQAPAGQFDLMVLDAYSSDSIPVHLITREALALYLDKLAPAGVLAFHTSNRYLDLKPVLGNLAQDAGLTALFERDLEVSEAELQAGKSPSEWVVLARDPADLGALARDPRWSPLPTQPSRRLWTDDFSSILSVLRWR
jgi:hypothetical protein